METLKKTRVAGGELAFYSHPSETCRCDMRFAVFLPPQAEQGPVPVLYWLSGLTCTEENFMTKAAAWRDAAEHGIALVAPDTSPRGTDLPGEHDDWDFGSGAGFYLEATRKPWSDHYHMYDYVVVELPALIDAEFPVDAKRIGIFGHSMGGHGALTIAQRNQDRYRSVSAFAPICAPMRCPWGQKAFSHYLGPDKNAWKAYDTCEILAAADHALPMLVDQGLADDFLAEQLMPEALEKVCADRGFDLTLRRHEGYDHSYYFIASFMPDHLAWHAVRLKA